MLRVRPIHLLSFCKSSGDIYFDNAVKDAGTRVIRPENSYNFKNPDMPRLVRVIEKVDES